MWKKRFSGSPALKMLSFIFVLSFCASFVKAQGYQADSSELKPSVNPLYVGLHGHYGFVLVHSASLNTLNNTYPFGITADIGWQMSTKYWWESCNCYPRLGIATSYWNFDKTEILGHGITVLPYIEPVYFTQGKFNLSMRIGLGVSLQTNPFDSISNPNNIAYSTLIAIPLHVGVGFNYRVDKHWNLKLAANYNHISNGGVKLPNKGINYPTTSLGVDYVIDGVDFLDRPKAPHKVLEDKHRFNIMPYFTMKNASPKDPVQYPVVGGMVYYAGYIGRKSYLTAGTEWIWDESRKVRIKEYTDGVPGLEVFDHQRGGIFVGHEFKLGRTIFGQVLGLYYYDKYKITHKINGKYVPLYQRFYLTYMVTDWLQGGMGLLTHKHVADFLDLRIGYVF